MGGAFTAVADDPSASFYNPAGLIQIDGNQLLFEYVMVLPRVSLQRGSVPRETYLDKPIKSPMIGIVLDLSRHWKFDRKVRFGLSGFVPDNFKSAAKIRYGTSYDPYYVRYGDSNVEQTAAMWINMAVELFPWLYFGGGFAWGQVGYDILLTMVMEPGQGENLISDLKLKEEFSKLEWKFGHEIAGMFGIMVKPLPDLRIGFALRRSLKLFFDGGIVGSGNVYLKGPDEIINIDDLIPGFPLVIPVHSHFRPLQIALGVSYFLFEQKLLLAYDVMYCDWRPYKDEMGVSDPNPKLKEVFVHRFGLEYAPLKDLALRAGYGYKPSPLEQQSGIWVNYMDNDVHVFSCGAGYTLSSLKYPVGFSIYYQFSYLASRTLQNVHAGEPPLTSSGYFHSFGGGVTLTF